VERALTTRFECSKIDIKRVSYRLILRKFFKGFIKKNERNLFFDHGLTMAFCLTYRAQGEGVKKRSQKSQKFKKLSKKTIASFLIF
jgi:hypothetical protein